MVTQSTEARTALLASIIDCSDDAIIAKAPDGAITSWNRGAERIYGFSAEEMIGQHVNMLVPPESSDDMQEILARVRGGERVDHYETVRRRKDDCAPDVVEGW
jgi:PAS domain S-box-containing protein